MIGYPHDDAILNSQFSYTDMPYEYKKRPKFHVIGTCLVYQNYTAALPSTVKNKTKPRNQEKLNQQLQFETIRAASGRVGFQSA
jgi:hypothetical protein